MENAQHYFEFIREKLQSPNKAEALSWLRGNPACTIWEHAHYRSVEMIQQLYELGAVEVMAVEIEGEVCCELLIRLPDDQHSRDRVFDWTAEQAESRGFDRDEDFGQEYLYVFFT